MTKSRDRRRKLLRKVNEGKIKMTYVDRDIKKIKHHTHPKFVLRGFSKNGKLDQFNTETHDSQSGIKIATVHKYFYTIYGNSDPDIFENAMDTDFETPAAEIFRQIINDKSWPLDDESDIILTRFITLQILRSPEKRRVDLSIARQVLESNEDFQKLSNRFYSDEVKEGELVAAHIDYWWNELAPELVYYIHSMKKILVRFPDDTLATSSSPVIPVYNITDVESKVVIGKEYLDTDQPLLAYASYDFTKSAALFYSLSRRVGLILLPPDSKCEISSFSGTKELSDIFNFLTGELSDVLYFHTDDSSYFKDFFSKRKNQSSYFKVQRLLKQLENSN